MNPMRSLVARLFAGSGWGLPAALVVGLYMLSRTAARSPESPGASGAVATEAGAVATEAGAVATEAGAVATEGEAVATESPPKPELSPPKPELSPPKAKLSLPRLSMPMANRSRRKLPRRSRKLSRSPRRPLWWPPAVAPRDPAHPGPLPASERKVGPGPWRHRLRAPSRKSPHGFGAGLDQRGFT